MTRRPAAAVRSSAATTGVVVPELAVGLWKIPAVWQADRYLSSDQARNALLARPILARIV